ncbi:beta-Ala-His dipeptidase [Nocardioides guangzhouensis]|uniref:Beta-Ala-His dipeptidase n=1 Tax=Nocardioides guangzhouensis TaxID=2497878 RepID=A0A4Q4Z1C7_9ACTN|nr:beta-Ala-His dipeptidase [Nocardioides guangzhouensis]RYP81282.1 beta-Ala-His dipeptidase [Nocardioides guangzhouensis]
MSEVSAQGGVDRLAWVDGLQPAVVWREFASIAALPRRSKQEAIVRAHVLSRLRQLGVHAITDAAGNVIADVPGKPGAKTVILQAHLDMVCEADVGAGTDPAVDGVFPAVADGWVRARGTTLGADDGIGVAVALAIAVEITSDAAMAERLSYPPLQLLFTVDEEEDFSGAAGVDPRLVTGRILLNLDSEDENEVIIGSAGGSRVFVRVPIDWEAAPAEGRCVQLAVRGLTGGHSGQQIDVNLTNAVKALGYVLALTGEDLAADPASRLRIADLSGGRADNAIPREARAVVLVDEHGYRVLERVAADVQQRVRAWRSGADDDAIVEIVKAPEPPDRMMSADAAQRIVDLLVALPSGVLSMDERLPGIVRTSTNLGVAYIEDGEAVLVSAPRSSRQADLDALHARYTSFARLGGGRAIVTSEYPAWPPEFQSALLGVVRDSHVDVYGQEPRVTAVHAGLEAGEIAAHLPELVAVSIGPTVEGAHSPKERLDVASVGRFYDVVRRILARLADSDLR